MGKNIKDVYKSEERNQIENGQTRHLDGGPGSDNTDAKDVP